MAEKRREKREECVEATFFVNEDGIYEGIIENIGHRGVFLRTNGEISVGSVIEVAVPALGKDREFKLKGEVVWKKGNGCGVEFKQHLNE